MRMVRLKVTFEMDYNVHDTWDDDMILFHVNESSSCSDNLLAMRLEQTKGDGGFCTCSVCEAEIVRERDRSESPESRVAAAIALAEKWTPFGTAGDCRKSILDVLRDRTIESVAGGL